MVDWELKGARECLSIQDQAELLSVNRTSLYRTAREVSEREVQIKNLIDRLHTEKPFRGSRTIVKNINAMNLGFRVNRKRIQRYMREMGIRTFYPGPNLSKRNRAQYVYPYLLRKVVAAHPNHVWGIDITYCAMKGRWMYLVAIIDWHSRMIVGYELSQTMNKEFVIRTVSKAIEEHGAPTILNSDQGSQFTCPAYVDVLRHHGVRISMDGKGRALDNAITERFWRTLKWENIYLHQYETPRQLREGIDAYIHEYNHERGHSSIADQFPAEVYYSTCPRPKEAA